MTETTIRLLVLLRANSLAIHSIKCFEMRDSKGKLRLTCWVTAAHWDNSKVKWNFKKKKKLKVELNTVCQWLVVCLN